MALILNIENTKEKIVYLSDEVKYAPFIHKVGKLLYARDKNYRNQRGTRRIDTMEDAINLLEYKGFTVKHIDEFPIKVTEIDKHTFQTKNGKIIKTKSIIAFLERYFELTCENDLFSYLKYHNIKDDNAMIMVDKIIKIAEEIKKYQNTPIYDHLGNQYQTYRQMCEAYGADYELFISRKRYGWTIKDALTIADSRECFDHLGNRYDTLKEMLEHYDITFSRYKTGLKQGLPLKQILEHQTRHIYKPEIIQDHNGQTFKSFQKMCNFHGIALSTFRARIKQGVSLKNALTIKTRTYNKRAM